jgi:hypothetical protein
MPLFVRSTTLPDLARPVFDISNLGPGLCVWRDRQWPRFEYRSALEVPMMTHDPSDVDDVVTMMWEATAGLADVQSPDLNLMVVVFQVLSTNDIALGGFLTWAQEPETVGDPLPEWLRTGLRSRPRARSAPLVPITAGNTTAYDLLLGG